MDERYEEEYRFYWRMCLNSVGAPQSEMLLPNNVERIKSEMTVDPRAKDDMFWILKKLYERRPFLVAADHNDMLRLKGDEQYIRMHPMRWLWTIDAVLAEYMYLVRHIKGNQSVWLPEEIQTVRAAYLKQRRKQRKELRIPIDRIKMKGRGRDAKGECLIPKYTGSAQLNLLCHDLCMDKRATLKKADILYDGKKFVLDSGRKADDSPLKTEKTTNGEQNPGDFIPAYTLGDYIYHELATGLSLSIEITAALMELAPEIRDFALEAFFEKGLSEVACSEYIYTRIAVARSFFHQIQLEWLKYSHSWDSKKELLTEEESKHQISQDMREELEDSIDFACFNLGWLRYGRYTDQILGHNYECYPDDRISVEKENDQEVLLQTDKKREKRKEKPAPWIVDYGQKEMELYIRTRPFSFQHMSVPEKETDLEEMIQYYEGLVEMMAYPMDLARWKQEEPTDLAVFVQKKHTHVRMLLDYLKQGKMRKASVEKEFLKEGERPVIFTDNCSICIEYYRKVHSRVQEACMATFKV